RPWTARGRPARLVRRRYQGQVGLQANRRPRPYPALDGLRRLGLGHGGWLTAAHPAEAVRLGHGAERPHSPDRAESRRQYDLPHRTLDRLSAARAPDRGIARTSDT